jgi:hypothetical protein
MSGQSGTLTYDFTPVPIAAVPEASNGAMMALGFGLLGLVGYRKTRSDNALASAGGLPSRRKRPQGITAAKCGDVERQSGS